MSLWNIWPAFIMVGRLGSIWFKWGKTKRIFQSITTISFFMAFLYTESEKRKKNKNKR